VQQTQADLHSSFKQWFRNLRQSLVERRDASQSAQASSESAMPESASVMEEVLKRRGTSWEDLAREWAVYWGRDLPATRAAADALSVHAHSADLGRICDVARRCGGEPVAPVQRLLVRYFDECSARRVGSASLALPEIRKPIPEELLELHRLMVEVLVMSPAPALRLLRDDLWINVVSKALGCSAASAPVGVHKQETQAMLPTKPESRPPSAPAWTWRPPDPSLPAHRPGEWTSSPDGVSAGEVLDGGWRFVSASVRGRGHKQDALFCDDSGRFLRVGRWHVLLTSDGAGSAKLSRVGSQEACDAAAYRLQRELLKCDLSGLELSEPDLKAIQESPGTDARLSGVIAALQQAFGDANDAIGNWVANRNHADPDLSAERAYIDSVMRGTDSEARRRATGAGPESPLLVLESDLHCTLLACLVASVPFRRTDGTKSTIILSVTCAIGDGMIVAFRKAGLPHPTLMLMAPDTGQFAGQTQFLTDKTAEPESVRSRVHATFLGAKEDLVAVVAMSDGVADDYYDGQSGMERLYCDLAMNGLLRCDPCDDDVVRARSAAEDALRARSERAASRILGLDGEFPPPIQPADDFRKKQLQKALAEQSDETTLSSLVKREYLLGPLPESAQPTSVAIKYASVYLGALDIKPSKLLADPALLRAIAECDPCSVAEPVEAADPNPSCRATADRLRRWMDAYIVKGSFDDRTMVVLDAGAVA
jgi:hypothetical protein